jgi:hypothetical protein
VAPHELKLLHIIWLVNEVHLMQLVADDWKQKHIKENQIM